MIWIWSEWSSEVKKNPMQPVERAEDGVIRFKKNRIVRDLLDFASEHGLDLNEIARREYSGDDLSQLSQLIGYSVDGYADLSYRRKSHVEKADRLSKDL